LVPAAAEVVTTRVLLTSIFCFCAILAIPSVAAPPGAPRQDPGAIGRWQEAVARNTAVRMLDELRVLDAAVDQWTIEHNKPIGAIPTPQELSVYVRKATRLHGELIAGRLNDALGNPMTLRGAGSTPLIAKATVEQFAAVMQPGFWKPFYEGPEPSKAPPPEPAPLNPTTIPELRLTAIRLIEEMRTIDTAVDKWGVENNQPEGTQPRPQDLLPYVDKGSRLHGELAAGRLNDSLGNQITISPFGQTCTISITTARRLATTVPAGFWGPFEKK
jgi:hypothetical protein